MCFVLIGALWLIGLASAYSTPAYSEVSPAQPPAVQSPLGQSPLGRSPVQRPSDGQAGVPDKQADSSLPSGGVIKPPPDATPDTTLRPPNVDPGMAISPPGTPGGNPTVNPK
jgi:hypothetical protein